jgi:hypothetical protein
MCNWVIEGTAAFDERCVLLAEALMSALSAVA